MNDMILWAYIVQDSDIWWLHTRLGAIRTLHNSDSRCGWVCNQSQENMPFSKIKSVPTNEVRNNLDRNPGLRSPGGIPPPLEIAL